MADPVKLMQPLRTESLRLRPSAQAQFVPPSQTETPPGPSPQPLAAPLMAPVQSLSKPQSPSSVAQPPPQEKAQTNPSAGDTLEDLLKSFINETSDEENAAEEPDAIPTEQMPQPVFVPLYEDPPRRRRRWPWIVLFILCVLGAAAAAACRTGYLESILP